MELLLKKEPVFLNEVIYDGQIEQGVEFDYVLPDYYPDIFKILKCSLIPGISSYSISGTQLFIDGTVLIKILYLSEDNVIIHCVEHRYTYSKTVEMSKAADKPTIKIDTKTDYANCRAVSGRRFDVRGAVSCKIKASSVKTVEIISGADNLETRSETLTYCGNKLIGGGQFVIREDIETGTGKGGILNIIHCDANAEINDIKVIAGKAVIKGEANVKALYLVKIDDDTQDTEVMEAAIPISRIIDMDGLDDSYSCSVDARIMNCSLEIVNEEGRENRLLSCELTLDCKVTANRESNMSILTDLFSTDYETEYTKSGIKVEYAPTQLQKQLSHKTVLECKEGSLEEIFDCRCDINSIGCRFDGEGSVIITGQLTSQAVGRLSESGTPVFLEKTEPIELSCDVSTDDENCTLEPNVRITDVSFNINGDASAELRITFVLGGCIYKIKNVSIIESVLLDEEKPKEKNTDYGLKMYYAEENEEIFAVAKKYNTKPEAIMEENELEEEVLSAPCLLLIPIV